MNFTLRSFAFGAALLASCASFAGTVTTLWADDFEWLEPWSTWRPIDGKPSGDTVGEDDPGANSPNLVTPYTGSVSEGTAVTVYQALIAKGYEFLAEHASTKSAREAAKQIYLQHNYLKFGLTGYYSGIVIPVEGKSENTAFIEFDWCSQRQGSGVFDPTKLVVIVKNGENEVQFPVPFKQYETGGALYWTHEKMELTGASITPDTKIIIRNADEQWPASDASAERYFLDNIHVYDYSPLDVIAAEDFDWFATKVDGNAVDSCPEETFDEVGLNEPGKASKWSSSQYFGSFATGRYLTGYDKMVSMGYEFKYVKAEGKKDRNGTGSVVYVMKDYVKFGLTGYQAGISIPAKSSVEGTATLAFDWCPQYNGNGVYDAVELVVIVRNGNTVKKTFAVPAAGIADGEPLRWVHVEIPLEGVVVNKGDFFEIRNADSQWPDVKAMRWYFDNFKVTGISKGDADKFVAPELYIKGDFNNWTANAASKLESDYEVSLFNDVAYTYNAPSLSGEILFSTADGSMTFGMGTNEIVYPDEQDKTNFKLTLGAGDTKIAVPTLSNAHITLYYSTSESKLPEIVVSGSIPVEVNGTRKAYAYDAKATLDNNGKLKLSYKSTEVAKSAALLIFPESGDAIVRELPAPVKGLNEVTVDVADVEGTCTWQINITSEIEGDEAQVVYRSPANFMINELTNGGVVWIRDPQSPAYGYTVVGYGNAGGFAIYDPEGNLLTETPVHKDYSGFTASYNRSVWRGDARGDVAVFVDASAASSGAWVIDPLNPTTEPYNMFMAPSATRNESNGIISYDAQQIAANGTCIAFQGEGDDTKAYSYLWNLYALTLVRYDLGSAKYITEAPSLVMSNYKSVMANQNIEVEALSEGFFVSQLRDDFNNSVYGLMYFNNEGELLWNIANKGVIGDATGHSISSGIAVNADETRLALSGYNEIYVFDLDFDAEGLPELSNAEIYPIAPANNVNSYGMQLVFDAADNLHVFSTCGNGYTVIALPGETTASTPGSDAIDFGSTGIKTVDCDKNAPAEFFNLQGFSVDGNALAPGIYIRRQGNTVSKVIIK